MTHLQYVAWPDHGVPDDSSDFLEFVNYVRSLRADAEPVLVHCRYWGLGWVCVFHIPTPRKGLEKVGRRQTHLSPTRLDVLEQSSIGYFFTASGDGELWEA